MPWQILATSVFAYLTGLGFYRLLLHPLAKFPGPKLAAVSRWYEGYYDVVRNGQYTFRIAEMHKQYGMVLIRPMMSAEPWKTIGGHKL